MAAKPTTTHTRDHSHAGHMIYARATLLSRGHWQGSWSVPSLCEYGGAFNDWARDADTALKEAIDDARHAVDAELTKRKEVARGIWTGWMSGVSA